ncbi:hypothetical protein AB0B15_38480 [Streptomyces sp. NPDC045456]|uniref:hypothetical protein n=1 Tax=Streptomyces sp. NPDC045456 TaxID=3155254 RepID=UPI0033C83F23
MSRRPTAAELREQRKKRREQQQNSETAGAAGSEAPAAAVAVIDEPVGKVIAQGRAEPMMRVQDLPSVVDAPEDLTGPLSAEEAERWEVCQRSFQQFREAWWVAARALEISLRGRLWRADYPTAKDFIADVTGGMSTSNAYRQIAGAKIAEIVAGQGAIEQESNDQSRMRDSAQDSAEPPKDQPQSLVISQRAAEAFTPIHKDYGPETAADMYRVVAEVTGKDTVSGKMITGIVQQIPRKAEEELDRDELLDRTRKLAQDDGKREQQQEHDPLKVFTRYVDDARKFANSTEGMAAAYAQAEAANPEAAKKLAKKLQRHMKKATHNFPNV